MMQQSPDLALSLATEGMLWFSDLTVPDSTLILPLSLGLISVANIQVTF
jgi:hypothetical protein